MKTASEYRVDAAKHAQNQQESFERCDTDGFLSQWASGINSQKASLNADIVDAGGVSKFTGLYEGERRVKAKMFESQYGWAWVMSDDEIDLIAQRGKKFLPTGSNSRILKQLGLAEKLEWAPAEAQTVGGGSGLSGITGVRVVAVRAGDKWGLDATLIEKENDDV